MCLLQLLEVLVRGSVHGQRCGRDQCMDRDVVQISAWVEMWPRSVVSCMGRNMALVSAQAGMWSRSSHGQRCGPDKCMNRNVEP